MKIFKKQKLNIISLCILIIFISLLVAPNVLAATLGIDKLTDGAEKTLKNAYGEEIKSTVSETEIPVIKPVINVLNQVLTFIGVIFLFLLFYAGYLWMNARGKEEEVAKAKKIMQEAVIGLVIILLARLITEFILTQVGKAIYTT